MSDGIEEIEAYKHTLKVAEDLLQYAGLPEELMKKYRAVKEKTFKKVRLTKEDLESKQLLGLKTSKAVIDDFATLFEYVYSSQTSLYEKLQNFAQDPESKTSKSEDLAGLRSFGLLRENHDEFLGKLTAFKSKNEHALRKSYENLIVTQMNKFENLEQRGLDTILKVGQMIVKQNESLQEKQYELQELLTAEQKLKFELEVIMAKTNQSKQLQSIELLERNQELTEQLNRQNERVNILRASHLEEINHLKDSYEIQVNELKDQIEELENQLRSSAGEQESFSRERIEQLSRELAEKSKQNDYLTNVVKAFRSELKPFYEKHMRTHYKSFDSKTAERRMDEDFDMIAFVCYLLQKFENDNIWLVEKLTELGNENEELRQKQEDLSSSRDTKKQELDIIFRQLKTELQDSKYAFMEWEHSIEALKKVLEEDQSELSARTTTA